MDRCRCDEYAEALKKMKFYTVGTLRPDILENFDRRGYDVKWCRRVPDYEDFKFSRPKAKLIGYGADTLSYEDRRIAQMWCPYMTPVRK